MVRYVYTTPYFKVKEVRVKGAGRLSEPTILGWAGVPLEKCIFAVNLRRISRRIESRPRVRKAKISRSFPLTIVIEVEERQPFVYLLCDKVLWEVDEEGTVLGEVDVLRDLAVITGISSPSQKERINSGVRIIKTCRKIGISFSEVNVKDEAQMVAYLRGGIKVYLGTGEHLEYLSYLPFIMADLKTKKKRTNYIDLRFNGQVVAGLE